MHGGGLLLVATTLVVAALGQHPDMDGLVQRAVAVQNSTTFKGAMVVNGRETKAGEWEGTVMVVGSSGSCSDSGLCTGMFIHPSVVMTAGHCCSAGATKAICAGKERPGTKLAHSINMVTRTSGANDFCLLHLNQAVNNVPIYQVATSVPIGNAIIVGYGVSNSGFPQNGAGIQREGLVQVTRVSGYDITVTGRPGQTYNNACNGDSGGPIFVPGGGGGANSYVVGGVTSRGSLYCPANSNSIYTSAIQSENANTIVTTTQGWIGGEGVVPGKCPVAQCCYSMTC